MLDLAHFSRFIHLQFTVAGLLDQPVAGLLDQPVKQFVLFNELIGHLTEMANHSPELKG